LHQAKSCLPEFPRFVEETFDFEILFKMLHHSGIDTQSKRKPPRSEFKSFPLRCDRVGQAASDGSIERFPERCTRTPHLLLQHSINVGIQGDRGSHSCIMMQTDGCVKMSKSAVPIAILTARWPATRHRLAISMNAVVNKIDYVDAG
jgi:hypothetical protein